jgi:hypothetical protein
MSAFLEEKLFALKTKVTLVQRDEVKDKVTFDYIVQSVNRITKHKVKVYSHLLSKFF